MTEREVGPIKQGENTHQRHEKDERAVGPTAEKRKAREGP